MNIEVFGVNTIGIKALQSLKINNIWSLILLFEILLDVILDRNIKLFSSNRTKY